MIRMARLAALAAVLMVLTYSLPVTQWLVSNVIASPQCSGLISSTIISLCFYFWWWRARFFFWFPASCPWKIVCYFVGTLVSILLIINILNQPTATITGQARSPFEVADVIVSAPIAEELNFRGVMWSVFVSLDRNGRMNVIPLMGTSLLFGVGHLGYWLQSYWPLPPAAMVHAVFMIGAGIGFGAIRLASRSLIAPIVMHMFANAAILLTQ